MIYFLSVQKDYSTKDVSRKCLYLIRVTPIGRNHEKKRSKAGSYQREPQTTFTTFSDSILPSCPKLQRQQI